jgi:hypothetical protein
VRELRRLALRAVCLVCAQRRGRAPTVEIDHPAGEEIQWDWLELVDTLWGQPATKPSKSSAARPARSSSASTSPASRYAAEIHEGLQIVETWNSANTELFYGKNSDLTGPDREEQEISMLALHRLQSALVHINTLLVERILSEPGLTASPTPTAARSRRCSGHTSTRTASSRSTWTASSTSTHPPQPSTPSLPPVTRTRAPGLHGRFGPGVLSGLGLGAGIMAVELPTAVTLLAASDGAWGEMLHVTRAPVRQRPRRRPRSPG